MAKFKDVRINLNTVGIGKVYLGDDDITESVRAVDIRASANELTEVFIQVVPVSVTLSFDEADVRVADA